MRRSSFMLVMAIGLVGLASCSGGSTRLEVAPNQLFAQIAQRGEDIRSGRFEFVESQSDGDIRTTFVGAFDVGTASLSAVQSQTAVPSAQSQLPEGFALPTEYIVVGSNHFFRGGIGVLLQAYPSTATPNVSDPGSQWFFYDASKLTSTPAAGVTEAFDPLSLFPRLASLRVRPENLGNEVVRDTETTHWRAELTIGELASLSTESDLPIDEATIAELAKEPAASIDIWVDSQVRTRRVTMQIHPQKVSELVPESTTSTVAEPSDADFDELLRKTLSWSMTLEFYDLDKPVSIAAPTTTPTDITEMLARLGK